MLGDSLQASNRECVLANEGRGFSRRAAAILMQNDVVDAADVFCLAANAAAC